VCEDRGGHLAGRFDRLINPELEFACADQQIIIVLSSRPEAEGPRRSSTPALPGPSVDGRIGLSLALRRSRGMLEVPLHLEIVIEVL